MPIVRIDLLIGRSPEQKATLIRRVTAAVAESIDAHPEQIRVLLNELPPEHWAVGGQSMAERASAAATKEPSA